MNIQRQLIKASDDQFGRTSIAGKKPYKDDVWEYRELADIIEESMRMYGDNQSEAAWNTFVHSKILSLAVKFAEDTRCENITTARIKEEFRPLGADAKRSISKMIDFAIVIRPAIGSRLHSSILNIFRTQLTEGQTINQSGVECLSKYPSAIHIETKKQKSNSPGRIQLGVWLSALYKRFYSLLGNDTSIITIPLLIAHGYYWTLFFACQQGDGAVLLGPFDIGNTTYIRNAYQLLAVLRALTEWADGEFRIWIQGKLDAANGG